MFRMNESLLDRTLRVIIGLALLAWFMVDHGAGFWHYAKLIGLVALITGLVGTCPIYAIFGISTAKKP